MKVQFYKLSEYSQLKREFGDCFGGRISDFYEAELSVGLGFPCFSIGKLDTFFTKMGMPDNESMNDFVMRKYGDAGLQIFNKMALI